MLKITALEGGILISLREVMRRLGDPVAASWSLKELDIISGSPLIGNVFELEERSRSPQGVIMTQDQFMNFATLDFQLSDGIVEGVDCQTQGGFLRMTCVDSSLWEIETNVGGLLEHIKKNRSG